MNSSSLTIASRRLIPALILAGTACAAWPADADITRCVASTAAGNIRIDCPNPTLERLAAALRQTGRVTVTYPDELGGTSLSVTTARGPIKDILVSALSTFDYAFIADAQGLSTPVSKIIVVGISANAPGVAAAQSTQLASLSNAQQSANVAGQMPVTPAAASPADPGMGYTLVASAQLPTGIGYVAPSLPGGVSADSTSVPVLQSIADATMLMPPPPSADSLPQMSIPSQNQRGGPIPFGNAGLPMPGMMPPGPM